MTDRSDRPEQPQNLEFQVRIPADSSRSPTVFFEDLDVFWRLLDRKREQGAEEVRRVLPLPPASTEVVPLPLPIHAVLDERQLPTMLTPAEAASVLRISRSSFYSRVQRGDIAGVVRKGGGRRSPILIDRDAFLRTLRGRTR